MVVTKHSLWFTRQGRCYDAPYLTLIDINATPKGLLGPLEFLKETSKIPSVSTPYYFGEHNWNRPFVESVYIGQFNGITNEGVVGKKKESGGRLTMAKAKTMVWFNMLTKLYGNKRGEELFLS